MENENLELKQEKRKSNKIIVLIIFILIIICGISLYFYLNKDTKKTKNQDLNTITIYEGEDYYCYESNEYCNKKVVDIKSSDDHPLNTNKTTEYVYKKDIFSFKKPYLEILYRVNDEVYSYDLKTKKTSKLSIKNASNYEYLIRETDNYFFAYSDRKANKPDASGDTYYDADIELIAYVIDAKSGKELHKFDVKLDGHVESKLIVHGSDIIVKFARSWGQVPSFVYYTVDGKKFGETVTSVNQYTSENDNDIVVAIEDYETNTGKVEKYDYKGNLISTKSYDNIENVIDDYLVRKIDNNLYLSNINTDEDILLGEVAPNNQYLNWYGSGILEGHDGLKVFKIEYYNEQEGKGTEFYYDFSNKEARRVETNN